MSDADIDNTTLHLLLLTNQELAHIYVGLRPLQAYKTEGHGFVAADNLGHVDTMTPEQLYELMEKIQTGKLEPDQGTVLNFFGRRGADEFGPYIATARENYATDELEIDDHPLVSPGGDPGVWVNAWIWISDNEAGVEDDAG